MLHRIEDLRIKESKVLLPPAFLEEEMPVTENTVHTVRQARTEIGAILRGEDRRLLMSRRVDPTSQGKLQGAINSIRAISGMIGPLLFTQVLAIAISPSISVHFPGAPYFLAGLLLLSSLTLAGYVTRADVSSPQPTAKIAVSPGPAD